MDSRDEDGFELPPGLSPLTVLTCREMSLPKDVADKLRKMPPSKIENDQAHDTTGESSPGSD